MRHIRRAAVTGLFALWLAPLAAEAGSQSSDSSSNCSNGRCTVIERFRVDDDRGSRGWVRTESWRERGARPPAHWGWGWGPPEYRRPPRHRGDDDDD